MFGPAIPADARFNKSKAFVDFLLTKIINAENAAHRSGSVTLYNGSGFIS